MCFQLTSEYIMYIPCIYQYIYVYTKYIPYLYLYIQLISHVHLVFRVSWHASATRTAHAWLRGQPARRSWWSWFWYPRYTRFALSWKLSERDCWIKMEQHVTGARTGYVFDGIYNVYTWYMHVIYCVYTIYIKKIWTAYAENLNVIYIVYVKYIPSKWLVYAWHILFIYHIYQKNMNCICRKFKCDLHCIC